jgi:hypothetical protein
MRARKVSKSKPKKIREKSFLTDKKKRRVAYIGVFLIALMVGSMFIQGGEDSGQEYDYGDYTFIQMQGYWVMLSGDQQIPFRYGPKSLENISVAEFELDSTKVYLGFVPGEESLESSAIQRLRALLGLTSDIVVPACLVEEGCPDVPLIHCVDEKSMVWLNRAEEDSIKIEDNCIVLNYEGDADKIMDLFTYRLLGVMK